MHLVNKKKIKQTPHSKKEWGYSYLTFIRVRYFINTCIKHTNYNYFSLSFFKLLIPQINNKSTPTHVTIEKWIRASNS